MQIYEIIALVSCTTAVVVFWSRKALKFPEFKNPELSIEFLLVAAGAVLSIFLMLANWRSSGNETTFVILMLIAFSNYFAQLNIASINKRRTLPQNIWPGVMWVIFAFMLIFLHFNRGVYSGFYLNLAIPIIFIAVSTFVAFSGRKVAK